MSVPGSRLGERQATMKSSILCGDNSFGPAIKSAACRGGFDFTGDSMTLLYNELQTEATF